MTKLPPTPEEEPFDEREPARSVIIAAVIVAILAGALFVGGFWEDDPEGNAAAPAAVANASSRPS